LDFLVVQFFLPTIQSSIQLFATSWFATNKAQDMLPLVMRKSPVALASVSQLQAQVQPT
jgi:hypothetical protein